MYCEYYLSISVLCYFIVLLHYISEGEILLLLLVTLQNKSSHTFDQSIKYDALLLIKLVYIIYNK